MKKVFRYAPLLLPALLFWSCVKEQTQITPVGGGEVNVVFKLVLPPASDQAPGTRAITSADENKITTIDVYPFVSHADGKFYFTGKVSRTAVAAGENPVSQFTTRLSAYPNNTQKLLFVVNDPNPSANSFGIEKLEEFGAAKKKLVFDQTPEWNTTSSTNFKPLPMYAETATAHAITESTSTLGETITLVRMLAKFSVTVKPYEVGTDPVADDPKLVLANICIFNRKNAGTIWYDTDAANWHSAEQRTKTPNMPDGTYDALTEYEPTTSFTAVGGVSEGQLYTFEAPANSADDKRTAIVIGGWYDGAAQTEANIRYYRVDVPSTVTDGHILRNCWYRIEVQKAKGTGSDTPKEAFEGGARIEAKIDVYTPANQNVVSDGQYFLEVSETDLVLGYAGEQKDILAETDYDRTDAGFPAGVRADQAEITYIPAVGAGGEWLALVDVSGHNGDLNRTIGFSTDANTSGNYRQARVKIRAGNFSTVIYVEQEGFEAFFDVTAIPEIPYYGATQNYAVTSYGILKTSKGNRNVDMPWTAEFSGDDGATWAVEKPDWFDAFTTSGPGGAATSYPATITAFSPTSDDPEELALKAANERGSEDLPYDLSTKGGLSDANTANCYIVNGPGYYQFPLVYGNAIKDGATNLSAYTSPVVNANALSVYRNHNDNNITDPYLYNNAGVVPDNVSIVWMDAPGLVTDLQLVDGNQSIAFEVTRTNISQGNAVVAVRDASNTILWSWHIWVTPLVDMENPTYDEVTNFQGVVYNFMQYNTGWCEGSTINYGTAPRSVKIRIGHAPYFKELTVTQKNGSIITMGNSPYWVWGRKDPYIGGGIGPGSTDKKNYGPSEYAWARSGSRVTVGGAIKAPHVFVTVGSWCSQYLLNLWNSDNINTAANDGPVAKTIYDPNPVGFKMPANNAWTGFTVNGTNTNSANANIEGAWDMGFRFYTNSSKTATVYYPSEGHRSPDTGTGQIYSYTNSAYYWSATMETQLTCRYMRLQPNSVYVNYTPYGHPGYGYSIRSVAE